MSIDFEKLKYAHELADKWSKENGLLMMLIHRYGATQNDFILKYENNNYNYKSIDSLIVKLQELTQPSREALIDSQIEYWQNMKDESVTNSHQLDCKHENDGMVYKIKDDDTEPYNPHYPFKFKCKKCGEFYR